MGAPNHSLFEQLTCKQIEVLELVAEGFTSKEIASRLGVAPRTVDQRVDAVRSKLGNVTRTALTREFREWRAMCGRTTYDPITIESPMAEAPKGLHQPEPAALLFEDVLVHDARAPWEMQGGLHSWSSVSPTDLSVRAKLVAIAIGAILLLAAGILSVSFYNGLSTILNP